MIVIGGSASSNLAKDLAQQLNAEYVQAVTKTFPDGETYARIEREALSGEVVIVQNSYPNEKFVELLLLQDAVWGLGAEKVTCVIPYFGYARQDERFNRGEPLSAKVMVEHIQMSADRVVLVDIHNPRIMDWFTKAKVKDVHAAPCVGDFFKEYGVDLVLAPDEGALKRAGWDGVVLHNSCDSWTQLFIDDDRVQFNDATYLLGTDEFGRDILSRLLYGARISFQVGAIAVLTARGRAEAGR